MWLNFFIRFIVVKSSHYFFWFGLVWLSVVKALKQVSALLRTVQSSSCTSLFAPTLLRSICTAICANNLHQTCTKHTLAALTLLYKSFVQTTCTKQFALHYLPQHYTWFHSHCYSNSSNCSVQKQPHYIVQTNCTSLFAVVPKLRSKHHC